MLAARGLPAGRRRTDPERRRAAGRRHRVRLPAGAADPPRDNGGSQTVYDHNFCLAAQRGGLKQAAWAQGAASGVEMEVWTTEPGVQFYAGHKVGARAGRPRRPPLQGFAGFCLEPQVWPDLPNRPYFPQAVLWPGEIYRQTTEYRFRRGSLAAVERRPQRLERRQRAAHLDDGGRHRMRLARRIGRRDAGKPCGEIGAVEGIAGAGRVDGRGDVDRPARIRCVAIAPAPAPAPRRSSRRSRRRRVRRSVPPSPRDRRRRTAPARRGRSAARCRRLQRFDDRRARRFGIRPKPRPVVRIEGDQRSRLALPCRARRAALPRARGSRIARADSGKIDKRPVFKAFCQCGRIVGEPCAPPHRSANR